MRVFNESFPGNISTVVLDKINTQTKEGLEQFLCHQARDPSL